MNIQDLETVVNSGSLHILNELMLFCSEDWA